jgi:hypothetical protein
MKIDKYICVVAIAHIIRQVWEPDESMWVVW